MYPECVAFLRKTMRVREIVLMHLSHSHGFAQKRNASGYMGRHPNMARGINQLGPYSRNDDTRSRMREVLAVSF